MKQNNNLIFLFIALLIGFAVGLVMVSGTGNDEAKQRIKTLQDSITIQKDSIRARDLLIDSLSREQVKADGVITDLQEKIRKSRSVYNQEKTRIDKLTNYELQKEIMDYYSTTSD